MGLEQRDSWALRPKNMYSYNYCLICGLVVVMAALTAVSGHEDGDLGWKCYSLGSFSQSDYPYCKELSNEMALHWKVDRGFITFGIAVAGKYKFIGLGISNSGGMKGADMVILNKEESATAGTAWVLGDYFSTDFVTPVKDQQQDYTLLSYAGTATSTLVEVQRPLDTCDSQDIQIFDDTDQMIVYAYGQRFGYHGDQRGSLLLRLNPANYNTTLNITSISNRTASSTALRNTTEYTYKMALMAQDPPDLLPLTVSLQPVAVSAPGVSYQCIGGALPTGNKYHIIRYEGLVASTDTSPVARVTLYGCSAQPAKLTSYDCGGTPDPACTVPLAFYAPGMRTFSLPPETGLPFGSSSSTHYQLVVQYERPTSTATPPVTDSSGIKLYYTAQLRPYDMGVLRLGSASATPSATSPTSSSDDWCPAACTARLPERVTLVSSLFSMGREGVSITTRHVRNGSELQPLGYKNWWWDEWQGFSQVLPASHVLLPGDSLITSCTYNRSLTSADACLNFLHYYPAVTGYSNCSRLGDSGVSSCPLQPTPPVLTLTAPAASPDTLPIASTTNTSSPAGNATLGSLPLMTPADALTWTLYDALDRVQAPGSATTPKLSAADLYTLATAISATLSNATLPLDKLTPALQSSLTTFAANANVSLTLRPGPLDAITTANNELRNWVDYNALALTLTATTHPFSISKASPGSLITVLPSLLGGRLQPSNPLLAAANTSLALVSLESFAAAMNASYFAQVFPIALASSADTNFTTYIPVCGRVVPPAPPHYATGPAVASIICITIIMLSIIAYLWVNYAQKEDPERQALLAALQETILQEAVNHPELSEAELKIKLEAQLRKKMQEQETIRAAHDG